MSARARLLLGVFACFLAVACGGAPGPLAPPFPPGEQLPEGAQEPFRPKLVLFVNGQPVQVLDAIECSNRDWMFGNVPVQPGDQVQVAAFDLEGKEVYRDELGTVPTLPEYLKDVLENMTPDGERIVGALEGIPFGFHSMDALGEYHPDIDELHLGTDLESWPTEILLVVFAHEGSHALDDAEGYQLVDVNALAAGYVGVQETHVAYAIAEQSHNQAVNDPGTTPEQLAAAEEQLKQAERARDEADAAYQAIIDENWPRYFETEVTAFKRELEAWQALGPLDTTAWPADSQQFAEVENYLMLLSEGGLRRAIAPEYAADYIAATAVEIPGVGWIKFIPTNLP